MRTFFCFPLYAQRTKSSLACLKTKGFQRHRESYSLRLQKALLFASSKPIIIISRLSGGTEFHRYRKEFIIPSVRKDLKSLCCTSEAIDNCATWMTYYIYAYLYANCVY